MFYPLNNKRISFMKTIVLAAVAALAAMATPAAAQDFTGARVGATVGYDNVQGVEDVAYNAVVGYDLAVAPRVTLGAEATLGDSEVSTAGVAASRDVGVSLRAGYVLTPRLLAFGKVGYATTRVETLVGNTNFEGVRFGGGLEMAVTKDLYVSAEYARTEYEAGIGGRDQALIGFGVRF
jgi:outer membrane immunogenic protein